MSSASLSSPCAFYIYYTNKHGGYIIKKKEEKKKTLLEISIVNFLPFEGIFSFSGRWKFLHRGKQLFKLKTTGNNIVFTYDRQMASNLLRLSHAYSPYTLDVC